MDTAHPYFENALQALDDGNATALSQLLKEHPDLIRAESMSETGCYAGYFWRPTLLHHIAGNPIRGPLPKNIVEITKVLLDAGADVTATCGGGPSQPDTGRGTVLGLLVSGSQAHQQGFTETLLDLLIDTGTQLNDDNNGGLMWAALYHTVEHQGQREVARMLYDRGRINPP